jgi:cation diffusion facilitator family transporter
MGFDSLDRRYMSMIAVSFGGGPVGIETIAAGLSEPRDAIEEIVEPYLIQQGFVQRTPRGRAFAIGLSAFAYAAVRRYAADPRFAFGTWKIEVLAGFASALFLLGIATLMVVGSLERLWSPEPIHYREAIVVAVIGLLVNLICARPAGRCAPWARPWPCARPWPRHGDTHEHGHAHGEDLNLKSAYLHVIADAATSVLAIAALVGGWLMGWRWLDPAMGIVGAVLVAVWAKGLLLQTGRVLLDREMDHPVVDEIREGVEHGLADSHTRVADLHVWRVGRNAYSCALTVVTHSPTLDATAVRATFSMHEEIVHSTVEIQRCADSDEAAGSPSAREAC